MKHNSITFRLTAYSDAAGKYDPTAPLKGNEDNFYVDDDLGDDVPGRCQTDSEIFMTEYGCLMVVADGMGGMNAGEVASGIAIETVKEYFEPHKIDAKLAASSAGRRKYLEEVIKEADLRIKTDAKNNPEHEGMGSTIILAWIVGNKMTVSWCGDSRAYRYNPKSGLAPLSTDHSYVQELVNKGVISYDDTFEHPQGNIVTRSLGDPNHSARPETRDFDIYNNDIILLCSDGLSGVLRDRKTKDYNGNYYPGDTIEDIIAANTASMAQCRDALMSAAQNADWYDNVTVLLCQILNGAGDPPYIPFSSPARSLCQILNGAGDPPDESVSNKGKTEKTKSTWLKKGLAFVIPCIVCLTCGYFIGHFPYSKEGRNLPPSKFKVDSLQRTIDSLDNILNKVRDSSAIRARELNENFSERLKIIIDSLSKLSVQSANKTVNSAKVAESSRDSSELSPVSDTFSIKGNGQQ